MNNNSNKYRVSIYLGKENYETLEPIAELFGMNVAQLTRVIFDTGLQLVKATEKELLTDGKSKS